MSTPVYEDTQVAYPTVDLDLDAPPQEEEDLSKTAHIISPQGNAKLWNYLELNSNNVGEGTKLLVDYARATGAELVAICGYRWVPTQAVTNHAVCQQCMDIANRWIGEDEG